MTNLVEFPGLGLVFEVPRVAFTLFGVSVYWYGVLIGVGMALALVMAFTQARRFGIDSDRMVDVVMVGLVLAIICGRAYYVIFAEEPFTTFWQIIDLRSGGIAIYGGIIGAFVGAAVACKLRKVPTLPLFDLAAMGFLIGQCLGRWGNFFNQEAFGSNTSLPWGMISPATTAYLSWHQQSLAAAGIVVDPLAPVHPTFLYESLWCALGFVLLFAYRKKRKFNGEIFLLYIMWYGVGRAFIEGLRTDSLMSLGFGLRVSQVLAAASALVALGIWAYARKKTAGKPLTVPKLPPQQAKVNVQANGKSTKVLLVWPGEEKPPSRALREEIAQSAVEEFGAEGPTAIVFSLCEGQKPGTLWDKPVQDLLRMNVAGGTEAEPPAGEESPAPKTPPEQESPPEKTDDVER